MRQERYGPIHHATHPRPSREDRQGEILFNGTNLLTLSEAEMRKIRGRSISMIFQEPMTSLNPVFQIGDQISEVLRLHEGMSRKEAWNRSIEMLKMVGIPAPERRVMEYPHQLSGGMRQRAMIAMALACSPKLMIADEPTTALDVTIQAQILELMNRLQKEKGMSVILITHNLGVIAETARKVAVMYAGRIVEYTDVRSIFATPKHPYTQGLLKSIPRLDAGPWPEGKAGGDPRFGPFAPGPSRGMQVFQSLQIRLRSVCGRAPADRAGPRTPRPLLVV